VLPAARCATKYPALRKVYDQMSGQIIIYHGASIAMAAADIIIIVASCAVANHWCRSTFMCRICACSRNMLYGIMQLRHKEIRRTEPWKTHSAPLIATPKARLRRQLSALGKHSFLSRKPMVRLLVRSPRAGQVYDPIAR
jgi:hypothetical protein